MDKPPVLGYEEISIILEPLEECPNKRDDVIAQAQRDADVEWCGKKWRRDMNQTFRRLDRIDETNRELKELLVDYKMAIQQARTKVAREIFEEIEHKFFLITKPPVERPFPYAEQPREWQFLKDKYNKQSIGR